MTADPEKGEVNRMSRMKEFLLTVWDLLSIPFSRRSNVKDETDVQQEQAWYSNEFKPREGVDYGIVLKYAEDKYKELKDTFAALDKKADWLYGLTIAAIAAVYFLSPDKRMPSLMLGLPSLAFLVLAFISIIRTKAPGDRPSGMSIRGAIQCVESTENPSAIISANLHCAAKELAKINDWKATQIANASRALMVGFLLVPLVLLGPSPKKITSCGADCNPHETSLWVAGPKAEPVAEPVLAKGRSAERAATGPESE